jgi:hypothetical protein
MIQRQIGEFEGIEMHGSANRIAGHGGGANRNLPRVTAAADGGSITVYPDDATIEVMRTDGWGTVKAGFKRNEEGQLSELFVFKSTDGRGILLRLYRQQRPKIQISMSSHGRVAARPDAGACTVRRVTADGKDAFVFGIADQITVQPAQS